jgi:hypothetical protein
MTRGQPPDGWLTATQAKRKLGNITDGKLRTLTGKGEGKIEHWVPTGSKIGFYKEADVTTLVHKWNMEALVNGNPTLPGAHFGIAAKADMPEIVQLLIKIWGGNDTSAKRNAWLEKNPETCFVVRSHGKVKGCIFILSLTEEKTWQMIKMDRNQNTGVIEIGDILPFEAGKPANLLLLSMAANDVGIGEVNKRKWGSVIVRGLFNHVIDLGRRGIPVNLIAARSDSKDGINLMRHIGFTEIEPSGGNKNFIIDVKTSGIDFCMKHKAAYAEWQKSQG